MRLPSGDHTGPLPSAIFFESPPAETTSITALLLLFAARSGVDSSYAIHFPSGETCGAPMR